MNALDTSTSTDPAAASAERSLARLRGVNALLRAELAKLRAELAQQRDVGNPRRGNGNWTDAMRRGIPYADGYSATSARSTERLFKQLAGVARERQLAGGIRNSSDFDELPRPSTDEAQLEADFVRWGYCLVADAMSPAQVQAQLDRLVEQASAERRLGMATMISHAEQLVPNMVLKGAPHRDAVEFKECAAQRGPLVDRLLAKVLGEGFGLGCAHGSIVQQGGGLQELHIDQAFVPLPYPPFPFGSLIIWCYTEFNLEAGATCVVPGSHRTASGATSIRYDADLLSMVDGDPGLVAIDAPPGTCILTDTRVLHGCGKRSAEGRRYAMRCQYNRHFIRALHEQYEANLHVPDDVYAQLSPRLKQMMSIGVNDAPLGELSVDD